MAFCVVRGFRELTLPAQETVARLHMCKGCALAHADTLAHFADGLS